MMENGKAKAVAGGVGAAAVAFGILMTLWPQNEGTSLVAYRDSVGVWTICQGDTHNVVPGSVETPAGCMERMKRTVGAVIDAVDQEVTGPKTIGQYVAYGDFIGNAGQGNFRVSSMRRYANSGNLQASCDSFRLWFYAGNGKTDCRIRENNCLGIITRRELERKWCLGEAQ